MTRAFAIVPACGHSTRMGRPKLALPLGGRTVIERVVSTLRAGGIEHVVVVIGPHVLELAPLALAAGAELVVLSETTPDMRSTIEEGLDWIAGRYEPVADDRWLLAPADHPRFSAAVVRQLLAADGSIIVPTHGGRRGHPALFRWRHAAGILALPPNAGINTYLRSRTSEILELPVDDAGMLANLDTPEDYERMLGSA